MKSLLQNPKNTWCRTGGGKAKESPALSDGNCPHVHPRIPSFIQLLMGLS